MPSSIRALREPTAPREERKLLLPRVALLLLLLYLFFVAIRLLESGIKLFGGGDAAPDLFAGVGSPMAALAAGVLGTVLVQSSSVVTAIIVALVSSGAVQMHMAVPLVMGANVGTTITNTLVSIGHVRRGPDFQRAFAAATLHDLFNLLVVSVLLPLELATGYLEHTAAALAGRTGAAAGAAADFHGPVKQAVESGAALADGFVTAAMGLSGGVGGSLLVVAGVALIFFTLPAITRTMRQIVAQRAEQALNTALRKAGYVGILVGFVITVAMQSSSITTSLLVPLCGAGVLSLESAFALVLGANLGTTITALLASLVTNAAGLQIAFVHILFNLTGIVLFYPVKALRRIPIGLARRLAVRSARRYLWIPGYVLLVFVILPFLGILLFR